MLHSFRAESKQQNMLLLKKMNKANKNYEIILCIPGKKKRKKKGLFVTKPYKML